MAVAMAVMTDVGGPERKPDASLALVEAVHRCHREEPQRV